jgi:hypothetical protein
MTQRFLHHDTVGDAVLQWVVRRWPWLLMLLLVVAIGATAFGAATFRVLFAEPTNGVAGANVFLGTNKFFFATSNAASGSNWTVTLTNAISCHTNLKVQLIGDNGSPGPFSTNLSVWDYSTIILTSKVVTGTYRALSTNEIAVDGTSFPTQMFFRSIVNLK